MAIEQTVKDEVVSHLNKAKGEVDAAWSVLHEGEDAGTNPCIIVDRLGKQVDKVTDAVKNLGQNLVECNTCHEAIKPNEPCYQLRQGAIEDDGVTFLPDEDVGYYHPLCLVRFP